MAIYHLSAQIISRGQGRSAVAAAAYRSGEQIENKHDGIIHDYTAKGGIVHSEIILPANAPPEWADRGRLWNEVEQAEKQNNAALAREINVALPVELDREEQVDLIRDYCNANFVSAGMVADVNIHDPPQRDADGKVIYDAAGNEIHNNPHAHIMLTVRPLDDQGNWVAKSHKEYVCERSGEIKNFAPTEYKEAAKEGWEKRYQYATPDGKQWLPPSQADGLERISKAPQAVTVMDGKAEEWKSKEALLKWREDWAAKCNARLREKGVEEIDHRSNADRGMEQVPTVHEGPQIRAMSDKGIDTDVARQNRKAKAINAKLEEWKKEIRELADKARDKGREAYHQIAQKLEDIRARYIRHDYAAQKEAEQIVDGQNVQYQATRTVQAADAYRQYDQAARDTQTRIDDLQQRRNEAPLLQRRQLGREISSAQERLEEIADTQQGILRQGNYDSPADLYKAADEAQETIKRQTDLQKAHSQTIDDRDMAGREYRQGKQSLNEAEREPVSEAQQEIRDDDKLAAEIKEKERQQYDPTKMAAAVAAAEKLEKGEKQDEREREQEKQDELERQ